MMGMPEILVKESIFCPMFDHVSSESDGILRLRCLHRI